MDFACVYLYPDDFPSAFLNITLHHCRYARMHTRRQAHRGSCSQRIQFSRDKHVWMNRCYIDVKSYLRTIYEIVITSGGSRGGTTATDEKAGGTCVHLTLH
jgi:hypothetical protein